MNGAQETFGAAFLETAAETAYGCGCGDPIFGFMDVNFGRNKLDEENG